MNIGKNVRRIREEKRLSQTELATAVHVSQTLIARIENETKQPSVAILKSIADYLCVTIDELCT